MAEKDKLGGDRYKSSPYDNQLFGEGKTEKEVCACCHFPPPKRYIVAILGMFGFANVYALRVNLSVALVAMVSNHTVYKNGTWVEIPAEFSWSTQLQGIILGAFFYGYILTQLPGGLLAIKFGGKNLFGFGVFFTSAATLLIPVAARGNVGILIALRILIGICEGVVFPANHALWSKWAPPLERSKLTTIAVSGAHIGTVLAMSLSGVIAYSITWPAIFYIFGSTGLLWSVIWFLVVRNTPADDPNISPEELHYIQSALRESGTLSKDSHKPVPWKAIATSLPFWAITVAHFSENWGFYTLLTELPSYLKHTLKFNLAKAGFVSAAPYLVMAFVVQVGGNLADCLRSKDILTTTNVRKLCNSIGFITQAIALVIVGYTGDWKLVVTCLIISVGLNGFVYSGFFVNHLDIAPQYACVLMGLTNTIATLPGIFSPLLTGIIVQRHTHSEWRVVFYISAAVYAFGAIFYSIFASGDVQIWASETSGYEEVLLDNKDLAVDDDEQEILHR